MLTYRTHQALGANVQEPFAAYFPSLCLIFIGFKIMTKAFKIWALESNC